MAHKNHNSQIPMYSNPPTTEDKMEALYAADSLRLEVVTTCVGFDDILDVTLGLNKHIVDTFIVVTDHKDKRTAQVARKHGAICVKTDLFYKNGRNFNKGAAINAGMHRFQYHGWRMHIDSDIIFPVNMRQMLFNHSHLDRNSIYGADRIDVIGMKELEGIVGKNQHSHGVFLDPHHHRVIGHRYVDTLRGYCPIGYFQLFHASCQKPYPYSLGDASHDDVLFCDEWDSAHRRLLPNVIVYHLCAQPPKLAENWDGRRRQPRIDGKSS